MNIYTIWNDDELELVTSDLEQAQLKHEEVLLNPEGTGRPFVEIWNNGKVADSYDYLYGWRDGKFKVPEVEIRTDFLKAIQEDDSLEELCAFCWALDFELLDESLGFAEKEMREKLEYIVTEIDLRNATKMYKDLVNKRRLERGLIKPDTNVELSDEVINLLSRLGIANNEEMRSIVTNKALLDYFANNPQLLEVVE